MAGEIDLLPLGVLTNLIGHDASNVAGKMQAPYPLLGSASFLSNGALNPLRVGIAGLFGANGAPGIGGRLPLVLQGDSTMAGVGVGTAGSSFATGARARAWPAQLAKLLTAGGVPAQINSVFGDSNMSQFVSYGSYDPRVVLGVGWVTNNINGVPGGAPFTFTNAGSGGFNNASSTFSFTPENPFDSFEIFWRNRAAGTVTVNIDGGAPLTVASGLGAGGSTITLPSSYASFTNGRSGFSGLTRGAHTVNVVVQSGNPVDVVGVHAWDSTTAYLDIIPICQSGAKIADFDNSSYFGGTAYLPSWFPSIGYVLNNLTVNDTAGNTTAASYTAALTDQQAKFNIGGFNSAHVGHMLGPYVNGMGANVATSTIGAAILAYAQATGQPVYDFASPWIGGAGNLTGGDNVHPTFYGATDIARRVARWLLSI